MNEQTWNEAIFDGINGDDLELLNIAFENGDLADYEPQPNDINAMSNADVVDHAHATRDAFLMDVSRHFC